MTAADTLKAKMGTLAAVRSDLVARIAALDADLARLQGFADRLTASPDVADLVEQLWAEAQR